MYSTTDNYWIMLSVVECILKVAFITLEITHTHTHIEKPMPMNSLFFLPGRMNDSKECGSTVISSNGQCVKVLESVFAFSYRLEPMLWVIVTALPDVCRRTGRYVCGSVCHMIVFWAGLRWWGLSHDGLLGQLSASQVWC